MKNVETYAREAERLIGASNVLLEGEEISRARVLVAQAQVYATLAAAAQAAS